jgi:hypothetical protein
MAREGVNRHVLRRLESAVAGQGIYLGFCEVAEESAMARLGYVPQGRDDSGLSRELVQVLVLYLDAEKQGLGSDGLVLAVVSPEDTATVLGRFTVDADWAGQYHDGVLSKQEVIEKMVATRETYDPDG